MRDTILSAVFLLVVMLVVMVPVIILFFRPYYTALTRYRDYRYTADVWRVFAFRDMVLYTTYGYKLKSPNSFKTPWNKLLIEEFADKKETVSTKMTARNLVLCYKVLNRLEWIDITDSDVTSFCEADSDAFNEVLSIIEFLDKPFEKTADRIKHLKNLSDVQLAALFYHYKGFYGGVPLYQTTSSPATFISRETVLNTLLLVASAFDSKASLMHATLVVKPDKKRRPSYHREALRSGKLMIAIPCLFEGENQLLLFIEKWNADLESHDKKIEDTLSCFLSYIGIDIRAPDFKLSVFNDGAPHEITTLTSDKFSIDDAHTVMSHLLPMKVTLLDSNVVCLNQLLPETMTLEIEFQHQRWLTL